MKISTYSVFIIINTNKMFKVFIASLLFITSVALYYYNYVSHNILVIVNILAFKSFVENLVKIITDTNYIILTIPKVMFIIFSYLVITTAVFFTVYEINNCIIQDCINNSSSYELLSIIINCILLLNIFCVILFDTNQCKIHHIVRERQEGEQNISINTTVTSQIKLILCIIIAILLSLNIVAIVNAKNEALNYPIEISIMSLLFSNMIIIIRFIIVRELTTFRHKFICVITIVAFVCNMVVSLLAYMYNVSLFRNGMIANFVIQIVGFIIMVVSMCYHKCNFVLVIEDGVEGKVEEQGEYKAMNV